MCFLPPMCLFCRHYRLDSAVDEPDCSAIAEIPDRIFRGEFDHRHPYPGDWGVRFELLPQHASDFAEVMEIREQLAKEA